MVPPGAKLTINRKQAALHSLRGRPGKRVKRAASHEVEPPLVQPLQQSHRPAVRNNTPHQDQMLASVQVDGVLNCSQRRRCQRHGVAAANKPYMRTTT